MVQGVAPQGPHAWLAHTAWQQGWRCNECAPSMSACRTPGRAAKKPEWGRRKVFATIGPRLASPPSWVTSRCGLPGSSQAVAAARPWPWQQSGRVAVRPWQQLGRGRGSQAVWQPGHGSQGVATVRPWQSGRGSSQAVWQSGHGSSQAVAAVRPCGSQAVAVRPSGSSQAVAPRRPPRQRDCQLAVQPAGP